MKQFRDPHRLLVITGPTASGKTVLALEVAKGFDAEIISADSRQVYKYLNFGTGKDLPLNAQFNPVRIGRGYKSLIFGYYEFEGIPVWGLDIVNPDYPFNVSDYKKYTKVVIKDIWARGKLPIIVGGTGLYIRALLDDLDSIDVPQDPELRKCLRELSLIELQGKLRALNLKKWQDMNQSDQKNPRRLTRAIELASALILPPKPSDQSGLPFDTALVLVLDASLELLSQKIAARERGDFLAEAKSLLKMGYSLGLQSMSALVYPKFRGREVDALTGSLSEDKLVEISASWNKSDLQYAKKQLLFFRKFFPAVTTKKRTIAWLPISQKDWPQAAHGVVQGWYSKYARTP